MIAEHGGLPVPMRTAADSLEALDAAVTSAANNDVLVFSGGSSVGDFTGFVSALILAAQPIRALGNLNAIVQEAAAALALALIWDSWVP